MDALGNVLRWYASMVDIDQLVVARLKRVDGNNRYLLCSLKRMLCYGKLIKPIACIYAKVD
jgi:hypothetical protein